MTADGLLFTQWFFENIWPFFTDWYIPGTAMSPAQLMFFILMVIIFMPFIKRFFNAISS